MSRAANWFVSTLCRGVFGWLGPVHVLHRERSERTGAYILASNHISHFDPPLLSAMVRRPIDWMAMTELFSTRWSAALFDAVDTIRTDRSGADLSSIRTALARLRQGRLVGIFPEGGIRAGSSSVLEGAPMRAGAASLAQMAGVPIVPAVILGGDRLYNPRSWFPPRRTAFWIVFGEPLEARPGLPKAEARACLEADLASALRLLYAEAREAYGLKPGDLPHTPQERQAEGHR